MNAFGQQPYELLITEIMADPTPARGLPEKEYVEIYNTTDRPIRISEYKLLYGKFETNLPDSLLPPKTYAVLVRKGNEEGFVNKFRVFPVAKLSLPNTGDNLKITKSGKIIHEVTYSDTWYVKGRDQGYSLEMIDLNFPCVGKNNWTSTKSLVGGTPSAANASAATNPDVSPPQLLFSENPEPDKILLNFNEKLDSFSVKNTANYQFSSPVSISKISIGNDAKDVTIILKTPLPDNEITSVILKNIADCSGNVAPAINFSVGNITPADSGDIILNEVLFDPKTGGGDYVELFNRSDRTVSLKNWLFGNTKVDGSIDKIEIISTNNLLMEPGSYLVFAENKNFISDFYPKFASNAVRIVAKLPVYRNTDGSVLLFNNSGKVFDRFDYNEKMHHPLIDNVDGVALEKRDPNVNSGRTDNWQSAAAEANFGTPGYQNSQSLSTSEVEEVTVSPEVFTPNGDGFNDVTEIMYSFTVSGNVATVSIFTATGMPVTILTQNQLLGTQGKFTWNGTDTAGNDLPLGYYLIVMDVFNPNGETKRFKKKVVLGRTN